jgi:hypothetical protein
MTRQVLVLLFSSLAMTVFGQIPYQLEAGVGPVLHFDDISEIQYFHIDTSLTDNVWQIGVPQKIFMDSTFSAPNALITDTADHYPTSNYSTVSMTLLATEGLMWFVFMHKYDTDTLKDGGKIELSIDAGTTWHNVLDAAYWSENGCSTSGLNFYSQSDTVASLGSQGFSGRSNGWEQTEFQFNYQNATISLDTFQLRFVFASDTADTGKEGWLIDDIHIYANHIGIEEFQFEGGSFYPNPTSGLLSFKDLKDPVRQVHICSASGQTIEILNQSNIDKLDLSHLRNGLYFVSVVTDKLTKTEKIVLNKE